MDKKLEFTSQAFCKMVMHAMKYPHSPCCGLLLSPADENHEHNQIIDAIPISHNSLYLASHVEVSLSSVSVYAQEQELVISGYYETDKINEPNGLSAFALRVSEKIAENYSRAVLCFISFEGPSAKAFFDLHFLIDGKWRHRPYEGYTVENDPDVIAESILYTEEKLYRQIVDFDDHFDNISLDWTNAKISQRIDHLLANIC